MPTTWEALAILVLFLIPGFISDTVFSRRAARPKREPTETVLSIVLWTMVNYALCSPLLLWLVPRAAPVGYRQYLITHLVPLSLLGILVGLVLPVLEALLAVKLARSDQVSTFFSRTLGLRVRSIPKGWDFVFSQNQYYLVLVTLTDGAKIGAGWGAKSFASSFPADEDVYFEVVYSIIDV